MGYAYSLSNELSRTAGHGALFHNNSTFASVLGHDASNSLKGSHVCCAAGTDTTLLRGRVDGDEDNVGLAYAFGYVGGEDKVSGPTGNSGLAIVGSGCIAVGRGLIGKGCLAPTVSSDAHNVV